MAGSNQDPVAVYCGSSTGDSEAFVKAAISVGSALAKASRPLVYGGGSKGIMGVVSGAALKHGGKVVGVVPYAMVAAGGEDEKAKKSAMVHLNEIGREKVETIVVDSMHERKVEMAKRSEAFIGLPGGFGTFEEVMEVITWTQIGIHKKPVVLVNVLGFWNPLKELISSSMNHGFISKSNDSLVIFVDGPKNLEQHEEFDWGSAALKAIEQWKPEGFTPIFDWTIRANGEKGDTLAST